jgi:hypothetical protein
MENDMHEGLNGMVSRSSSNAISTTGKRSALWPLASDDFPFMTGAQMVIDGGKTILGW